MKTRPLSAVCSATTQLGHPCSHRAMEGSSHCYAHDSRYENARKEAAAKGGRLGGRGRASISKEIGELRRLIGAVVELKAQDRLPTHIDYHMKDFLSLLKLYLSYAQLEVRTAKADELVPKRAFDNQRLMDAKALREEIEDLAYAANADERDEQHDPTRGGAA